MAAYGRGWTCTFLFYGIVFGMSPTIIPLYFVDCLHGSLFDFGVMSALARFLNILTLIYAGWLPKRFGRTKPFILISFLISSVVLFALTQATDIYLFQVLYILLNISNSISVPSTRILISETSQRADWSSMFTRQSLIGGLAGTTGLAVCSLSMLSLGYGTLFFICAFLMFSSFLMALVVVKDPPLYVERWLSRVSRPIDDVESLSYMISSRRSGRRFSFKPKVNMVLFGLGTLIYTIAASSASLSLPIFLSKVTLSAPSMIFAIFTFRSLFRTLSYMVIGKWVSRLEGGNAVKVASIARGVLVLLLPSIVFLPRLAPIMAVGLLSTTAFSQSLYSIDSRVVFTDYASEGSVGVYEALGSLGSVVGGLLSGLIPAMFGFNLLFMGASALFLIAFSIVRKSIS